MWESPVFWQMGGPGMKRKRYTEEQIISMLRQHGCGRTMVDLAREYGVAQKTRYCWHVKYGLVAFILGLSIFR
jgi:hypothetical protein